jgi:putative spermidine/putrescine transport system ATP-binding protein
MARDAALPITVRHVTKTYGKVIALDDVALDVQSGEFLTLLGPSGSGKTTLLMVLAGFTRPDHGSLKFGDREVIRLAPHKRDVGMVFQSYALFPHMDVAANIAYPLKLRGIARTEIAARAEHALETVKLGGYGSRRIDELSGGQRQRVALARAIVFEPRILLMDEPLSALDKQLREHMQIELRQLHDRLGMTTVYVTHDQREALTMSDRIAVMRNGRIEQIGTPEDIYERPATRFVAGFIGAINMQPAAVSSSTADGYARLETPAGAAVARLPRGFGPGAKTTLTVRPERLRLASHAPENSIIWPATVEHVVYLGARREIRLKLADGSMAVAELTNDGAGGTSPGDKVIAWFRPEDAWIIPEKSET